MKFDNYCNAEPGLGLEPIKMERLGQVVALVGKNGAGKSRILETLKSDDNSLELQLFLQDDHLLNSPGTGDKYFSSINIENVNFVMDSCGIGLELSKDNIDGVLLEVWDRCKYLYNAFTGKDIILDRPRNSLYFRFFEVDDYREMRLLDYEGMSPGEKIIIETILRLIQFYTNKKSVQAVRLILDEPELHLHPSALIEVIEKLRKFIGEDGQIWLATHSVALLSHLRQGEIWVVKDGQIFHPECTSYQRALEELFGSDLHIDNLHQITLHAAKHAAIKFAGECLIPPESIAAKDNDAQQSQFAQNIHTKLKASNLSVLDFGAGKGRLGEWLKAEAKAILGKIRYTAYDKHEFIEKKILEELCKNFAEGSRPATENCLEKSEKHDLAVMCNVLHEIPAGQWVAEFKRIADSLKDDGVLWIIEDTKLPAGELPHKDGFLVMTETELEKLFAPNNETLAYTYYGEDGKGDRLLLAEVTKSQFENVTQETISNAITTAKEQAFKQIERIRDEVDKIKGDGNDKRKKKASLSRLHAFYSQQYINCELYLKKIIGGG